jgi:hypothetical protein
MNRLILMIIIRERILIRKERRGGTERGRERERDPLLSL